jgi:Ca2+-binding EF-hand superfamily protein/cell division septum initiation protein DivIVA
MESSIGDVEGFQGAFALLDMRGFGKIGLEAIFDFVSACPNAPSIEEVTRMYNEFDEDGSGDIDSGEFVGFCDELEKVTGYSAKQMIGFFEKKQYEHLFSLVDNDGGGTISIGELKTLVEALHAMLDLKKTASDVRLIVKEYEKDELDFEDFYNVMKKLMGHKSILLVVRAFEEAQRRSKEVMSTALLRFERGTDKKEEPFVKRAPTMAKTVAICQTCKSKDAEMEFLRKRVSELEAAAAAAASAAASAHHAKPSVDNIEPRVRLAQRSLDMAISVQATFPAAKVAAQHYTRSTRLLQALETGARLDVSDMASHAKRLADLADDTHKAQRQVPPALEAACSAINQLLQEQRSFLDYFKSGGNGEGLRDKAAQGLAAAASLKMTVASLAETVAWTVEAAAEARTALATWGFALIPTSSNPRKFLRATNELELVTQQLLDVSGVVQWHGTDHPSELEILMDELNTGTGDAESRLTADDFERLEGYIQQDYARTSVEARTRLCASLKDTTYAVQSLSAALPSATKRERGVGTAPLEAILPAEPLKRIVPQPRHAPQSTPEHGAMSRPPRARDIFVIKDTRAPVVDAMLARYLASGVRVPDNFARVYTQDLKDALRHLFTFGTRRIEMFVVEDALSVKVGGGYLYFDEFCELYTDIEVKRVNRTVSRSPMPIGSASASPSRSASAREPSLSVASATVAPPRFSGARRGPAVYDPCSPSSPGRSSRNVSPLATRGYLNA